MLYYFIPFPWAPVHHIMRNFKSTTKNTTITKKNLTGGVDYYNLLTEVKYR